MQSTEAPSCKEADSNLNPGKPPLLLAQSSTGVELKSSAESKFLFISEQNPAGPKDPDKTRQVRSHAVKHALLSRRRPEQVSSSNQVGASGQTLAPWSVLAPDICLRSL